MNTSLCTLSRLDTWSNEYSPAKHRPALTLACGAALWQRVTQPVDIKQGTAWQAIVGRTVAGGGYSSSTVFANNAAAPAFTPARAARPALSRLSLTVPFLLLLFTVSLLLLSSLLLLCPRLFTLIATATMCARVVLITTALRAPFVLFNILYYG